MQFVEPKVHIIASTHVEAGLDTMLADLGVPGWHSDGHDAAEVLMEVAGKMCYMAFDTSLNKNLTKVGTRTNHEYLQ